MTGMHGSPPVKLLQTNVVPFASTQGVDSVTRFFDSVGETKVLLIGDASHGTSEFYSVRAEITKYMVQHHGFNIIAVEADWPDAEAVDRYVRHRPGPGPVASVQPATQAEKSGREPAFLRFPTWMWRNVEVQDFVEWLRKQNDGTPAKEAAGFYGLDLYSLQTSMRAVIEYLDNIDTDIAAIARKRYEKLMMWSEDPQEYGWEAMMTGFKGYEKEVLEMLRDLLKKRLEYASLHWDGEEFHGGEQNARLVKGRPTTPSVPLA